MAAGPQREGGLVFVPYQDEDTQEFDKGDLVARDSSGELYRASEETWDTSEAVTRKAFVTKFLGVASQNKKLGEPVRGNAGVNAAKVRVSTRGVYKFTPAAGTYLIGTMVGPEKAAGNTLLDTTVQVVTDPLEAIGCVVGMEGVNPTEIEVQVWSRKLPFENPSATAYAGSAAFAEDVVIDSNGSAALAVGPNGATNPTFSVDAATASAATGLKVTGAAAAGGVNLVVTSSGTNENLTVNAKGSGTLTLNGTATGNIVLGRAATGVSLAVTAGLTSSGPTGAGIGYATGAGGAVTQATDRTTGVTLSKLTGQITTNNASLAAGAEAEFTVTNTTVAATDTVILNITPGGTGTPFAYVSNVAAGSFKITVTNLHASTADTSADVINFAVIKGVAA